MKSKDIQKPNNSKVNKCTKCEQIRQILSIDKDGGKVKS